MSDVWGAFDQGEQIGYRLGERRRNADAYEQGGLEGVAEAAGGRGNLQTMETARTMTRNQRRFEDDERQAGYERMEQIAPFALAALNRAGQIPEDQRGQWLNAPHIRQRFIDWGLTDEQYDQAVVELTSPETAPQALESYRAAFQQHQNPEWELRNVPTEDGRGVEQRPIAIDPNNGGIIRGEGSLPAPPGDINQLGSGGLWRTNPNAPNGYEVLREPRVSGGAGGAPPSGYQWNEDGSVSPIRGGPRDPESQGARPFPADQRARVAISFEPALEAAQQLERAEANAISRQGTPQGNLGPVRGVLPGGHGSDTPFGQDWGARMAEAVPFDGGSTARMVGGEDYQAYTRASAAFEAAILPILSGAAVTESEAQRIVRAALPRYGDDQATLQAKARQRRQMLNGAALIGGRPPPYPEDAVAPWADRANRAVQSVPDLGGAGDGIPQGEYPPDYDPNDVSTWPDWALEGG